jgi:hypothetical protein
MIPLRRLMTSSRFSTSTSALEVIHAELLFCLTKAVFDWPASKGDSKDLSQRPTVPTGYAVGQDKQTYSKAVAPPAFRGTTGSISKVAAVSLSAVQQEAQQRQEEFRDSIF